MLPVLRYETMRVVVAFVFILRFLTIAFTATEPVSIHFPSDARRVEPFVLHSKSADRPVDRRHPADHRDLKQTDDDLPSRWPRRTP